MDDRLAAGLRRRGKAVRAPYEANFPGKKIAILYQNDDVGKDYLYGVRYALGPSYRDANVVRYESFELPGTNLTSQMVAGSARAVPRSS